MQPELLVIAPFDSQFQPVREAVHQAAQEAGFSVAPPNPYASGALRANFILECMRKADVIVADLSGQNADVMYELGFAHSFRKPTILLYRRNSDNYKLPNDLSGSMYIFYDLENLSELTEDVRMQIQPMALRWSA